MKKIVSSFNSIENTLMMWITALTWWIDVRFAKDTVWVAKMSFRLIIPALIILYELTFGGFLTKLSNDTVAAVSDCFLLIFVLIVLAFSEWSLFKHGWYSKLIPGSKNIPNMNKNSQYFRNTLVIHLMFLFYFLLKGMPWTALFFASSIITLYVLCVDPLTDEERARRRQAPEEENDLSGA